MNLTGLSVSSLIPSTSFLGKTLGNYSFNSNIITTNTINQDTLQFFDGLVLDSPQQAFLPSEITDIQNWVAQGGTLFVFATDQYHMNTASVNQLLEPFNLSCSPTSFYPYDTNGYYTYDLTRDYQEPNVGFEDLFANSGVNQIMLKNPINISSSSLNSYLLCNDMIGLTQYGAGKVIVVGDNGGFEDGLISDASNTQFAQTILNWGFSNYYQTSISPTHSDMSLGQQGFVMVNLTNTDLITEKNLTGPGFLFISLFFLSKWDLV